VRDALDATDLWATLRSPWVCLDCELMPWSAKAQELLRGQYAAVGTAARIGLAESIGILTEAATSGLDVGQLIASLTDRQQMAADYIRAYRRYCWPVESIDDLKLAPFHILATDNAVHIDKSNLWHMETISKFVAAQQKTSLVATSYKIIDLGNASSEAEGIAWWTEMTERGGEGMVVKPIDFIVQTGKGLAQPAVKCRGREYLRIIYGFEYTTPEHLEQLRQRNVSLKRSLAIREFALGIEALERFVRREPLRRVHEGVFGVLALESEPVDPRL
jgi:protein phosphatase